MHLTRKELFDNIALKGEENALDSIFIDGNAVEFEDGTVFNTIDELKEYLNERKEQVKNDITGLNPDDFK